MEDETFEQFEQRLARRGIDPKVAADVALIRATGHRVHVEPGWITIAVQAPHSVVWKFLTPTQIAARPGMGI